MGSWMGDTLYYTTLYFTGQEKLYIKQYYTSLGGRLSILNRNTHSINCTAVTVTAVTDAVPELLHFFLLKPLKSNFVQFLEEESTGQYIGAIPQGPYTLHIDQFIPPLEIRENWI